MDNNIKNEVPTVESSALQFNTEETDVNSVSSPTTNYTKEMAQSQITKNVDVERLVFPLEDTERTLQFEDNYPSKEELRELIDVCNIIRLHSKLHIYKDGIYISDIDLIKSKIYKVCDNINHSIVNNIVNDIELEVDSNENECSATLVGFNNYILDTQDLKPKKFNSADFVLTSKLAINYIELTAISNIDKRVKAVKIFFNKITCGNKKLELLLLIIIGMCCCRSNEFPFAFVLAGNTRNREDGRSEFLELIERILGNSVSHENLRQLADVKSSLEIYGKTCNISEEVERPNISYMDNLRKLIHAKEIKVCNAHSKLVFTPFTTMLINVNEILDFGTALFGLKDYFKIIPFNAKHPINQKILDILFETETLQYIALQGIKAYCQATRIAKLPVVDVVERATAGYFKDNNSVLEYCQENPIKGIICKSTYYFDYCRYCVENNLKRISRANFGTEIRKLGYERIRPSFKGKRVQCYIEQDFDLDKCRAEYIKYWNNQSTNEITDNDIIYENLIAFINGYNIEEIENSENEILGFE